MSCKLVNNEGKFKPISTQDNGGYVCKMEGLQATNLERGERQGDQTVMDVKWCVIFQTKLKMGGTPFNVSDLNFALKYSFSENRIEFFS